MVPQYPHPRADVQALYELMEGTLAQAVNERQYYKQRVRQLERLLKERGEDSAMKIVPTDEELAAARAYIDNALEIMGQSVPPKDRVQYEKSIYDCAVLAARYRLAAAKLN